MNMCRMGRQVAFLATLLVCFGFAGCKAHPQFDWDLTPLTPTVVPGGNNRFKLTFRVINLSKTDFPVHKFRVEADADYETPHGFYHPHFEWKLAAMDAETGVSGKQDFAFDEMNQDGYADPNCRCYKNECKGSILLTLFWNSGPDAGERVKGKNTRLKVSWKKPWTSFVDMTIEEK